MNGYAVWRYDGNAPMNHTVNINRCRYPPFHSQILSGMRVDLPLQKHLVRLPALFTDGMPYTNLVRR